MAARLLFATCAFGGLPAQAQSIEPRVYAPSARGRAFPGRGLRRLAGWLPRRHRPREPETVGARPCVRLCTHTGGATSVDGQKGNDLQRNWRVGATLAIPIDRRMSFKVNASRGVAARTGNNYDLAGVALQYRWGAGVP